MKYLLKLSYLIINLIFCFNLKLITSFDAIKMIHIISIKHQTIFRCNRITNIGIAFGFLRNPKLFMTSTIHNDIKNINNNHTNWKVSIKGGLKGIIQEQPKKGWYTIQLLDEQDQLLYKTQKARMTDFEIIEPIVPMVISETKLVSTIESSSSKLKTKRIPEMLSDVKDIIHEESIYCQAPKPIIAQQDSVLGVANDGGDKEYSIPIIHPPVMHQNCKNWIIFSDLHVKGASIDICEDVLREVHKAAIERNAGIIFLGDFWHVRGSLIVDLLNRVLKELRKWTQPVIMIPGNHDQVTLGGTIHALEPLLYAFQPNQIIMINEPSICMGALWIPYRRDPLTMKKVLDQVTATIDIPTTTTTKSTENTYNTSILGQEQSEAQPVVSMIFCHADVKGAYMNDGMRSSEGLDINIFPPNMPIYSGHFHKPHTITNKKSTLRYVGSPYQTSLSEAGQEKYFYCVQYDIPNNNTTTNTTNTTNRNSFNRINSDNNLHSKYWREIERWPISIGSKIIKASSLEDPLIKTANPGDRVVISVPIGQDYAAQKLVDELQLNGISNVELRPEQNPLSIRRLLSPDVVNNESLDALSVSNSDNNNSINSSSNANEANSSLKIEDMNPVRIFKSYMDDMESITKNVENEANVQAVVTNQEMQKKIFTEGMALIEKLMGTSTSSASSIMKDSSQYTSNSNNKVINLKLNSVTLSNFGPYASTVNYPLSKRGLVLLKGQSSDGTGADSNGSGKTTLAMSIMWALTGSLDARLVGDNRPTDVAFDASLVTNSNSRNNKSKVTAEVSLFGMINDQSFELIRRRNSKKTELSFKVDNQDLTTQSVKDTQIVVDQILGIGKGLIERCCFFGQHTHTLHSLLGLTDVKLKSELSNLVDTSIWITAVQELRSNDKQLKSHIVESNVESKLRNEEILKNKELLNDSMSILNKLKYDLQETEIQLIDIDAMNSSSNALVISNGKEKEIHIKNELEIIENSIKVLKLTKLDPLRIQLRKSQNNSLIEIDKIIEKYKLDLARLKSEQNNLMISINNNQQKIQNLNMQSFNLSKVIENFNKSFKLDLNNIIFNPQKYYSIYEIHSKNLTTVNLKIDEINLSLSRLNELKSNNNTTTNVLKHSKNCHNNTTTNNQILDYECPTCGQELPKQSRERRFLELTMELDFLNNKQVNIIKDCQISKKTYDTSLNLKQSLDQNKTFIERIHELKMEENTYQISLKSCISQLKSLEIQLNNEMSNKLLIEDELNQIQNHKTIELDEAEKDAFQLEIKKSNMIIELEKVRQELNEKLSIRNSYHTKLSLLKDRVVIAETLVKERQDNINSCNEVINQNELKIKELMDKINISEKLIFILGPKGIQNYVFQSVTLQLESIANGYLMILTDGGIQLSLQGDLEDTDRIVKSVLIRSKSDSKYRERTLSQLSGGQYRRVSLALDLAFAELIRRRGILRCNLMVMDEVLTHLDASGREAVGTVLRYMVGHTTNHINDSTIETKPVVDPTVGQEIDDDSTVLTNMDNTFDSNERNMKLKGWLLGGGNYETVIVILQDLAAAELEESFDHIDIVMKESDTSTVIIDGTH